MKIVKAPETFEEGLPSVFLAGSIEMGKAEDWQTRLTKALSGLDVMVLNPRRDDWDSSWKQERQNEKFSEQVLWELSALSRSNVIAMYFDPNTASPISLLELGLFARSKKMIVYCPEGFYRKGNVDIVCEKYGVQTANSFEELIAKVIMALGREEARRELR